MLGSTPRAKRILWDPTPDECDKTSTLTLITLCFKHTSDKCNFLRISKAMVFKEFLFNSYVNLRIPRDGGHDSMLMADSVPA